MATGSKRDVVLGVGVETSGEESLRGLAGDVRGLGTAAGESAAGLERAAAEEARLTAAVVAARQALSSARAAQDADKTALEAAVLARRRLTTETDQGTRATAEYQSKLAAAKTTENDAREALNLKSAAVRNAVSTLQQAKDAEDAFSASLRNAANAGRAQVQSNNAVRESVADLKGTLDTLRNVALAATGGSFIGSLAKDIAATAESAQSLEARLRIATGGGEALKSTLQGVYDVANRSGVAVDEVGALVTRLITAGKELGITNQQALGLAETLTQALRIGGASAQEAASSVLQFSQAIASGKLAGDELKSILEGAPRLAQALAAGLGVTVGQLKELGSTGALTSQQVIAALQGQSAAIQAQFDQMPKTVSRAIAGLSNAWTLYVSKANEGSGATSVAASAIEALARNLSTVAEFLYGAGKAGAAFAAVKLAAAFIESATAARAAAVATAAATAATTAHTAATAGSVANVGRFAAALASIKLGVFLALVTNLRDIGTAIGEGAAKWMGYGKAIEDAERAARTDEETTRRNAAEKAALAQRTQQAADAALGLNKEARQLVSEFDGVVLKTNDVSEALTKLSKDLRITDISGIQAAGAALDALGQRGKINAEQIKQALAEALKGDDLLRFETMARAAFDNSSQGARRLQAALDAITNESLRRAGTSLDELATGFSKTTTSAVNDLDIVARSLRDLKTPADEAGRVLTKAIDQALAAANTERAVQAVIDRVQALGKEGLLAGDRLAGALETARKKLDDIKPGVNTLAEAFRTLGLKAADEANRVAESFRKAYEVIATSGTTTIQQRIEAFAKYREAAIAANGGVESSEVALQRKMLETEASVKGLGTAFEQAMGRAEKATRSATAAITEQRNALAGNFDSSLNEYNKSVKAKTGGPSYDSQGFATDSTGQRITAGNQLQPPDASSNWEFIADQSVTSSAHGPYYVPRVGYWQPKTGSAAVGGPAGASGSGLGTGTPSNGAIGAQRAPTAAPAPSASSHTVTINLAGRSTTINTATADDASALAGVLRDLNEAASRA